MGIRPNPLTVTDELLVHLIDGHEQLAATVGEMRDLLRDRLPQPQSAAQDPPGTRELREPAMPGTGHQDDPDPEPEPEHQPAKRAAAKTAAARKATPAKRGTRASAKGGGQHV